MAVLHTEDPQGEEITHLGNALRSILAESGVETFSDGPKTAELLIRHGVTHMLALQTALLLETDNMRSYLTRISTNITMIDINTTVTCAERDTGLKRAAIKDILTAVLFGLNLPNTLARIPVLGKAGVESRDTALLPPHRYLRKLQNIKDAVENQNTEAFVQLAPQLDLLGKAGIPEALYWKGICYLKGFAVEKDEAQAYRLIAAAAEGGYAGANAALGDYYFGAAHPDFTKAYQYYTGIGAVALSHERRDNLKTILEEKPLNQKLLFLNTVLLALCLVFNWMLGSGSFSADAGSHWFWAAFSGLLGLGIYGGSIYQYARRKFNSLKWAAPAIMLAIMIGTLFAR